MAMGLLWIPWLALLAAVPAIEVEDPVACVDTAALAAALEQELPRDPGVAALSLRLQVVQLPPRTDQVAPLQLSFVLQDDRRQPLTRRSLEVARADCPQLPRLVASIVSRQLEALPRQAWSAPRKRPVAAALPAGAAIGPQGGLRLLEPIEPARPPWDLRLDVAWGFGLGVDRRSVDRVSSFSLGSAIINTHVSGIASLGWGAWPRLVLGLRGAVAQQTVGVGRVQVYDARALVGLAQDFALSNVVLAPQLLLTAGGRLASGVDFDRNYTIALPAVALQANLILYSGRVLSFGLGVEIPIVRMELRQRRGADSFVEPTLHAHAVVGFSWDLKI